MEQHQTCHTITKLEEHEFSDGVTQLISHRPVWLIRYGNTLLLLILFLIFSLSWVVKYPDVIQAPVRLIAVNSPKLLTARTDGKLEKLFVLNDQYVKKGDHLAFLQSTAKHEQVIALRNWISVVEKMAASNSLQMLINYPLPYFSNLGELQPGYQEFQHVFNETIQIFGSGYYQQKKRNLLKDLQYLDIMQEIVRRQQQLLQQDLSLQETEFKVKERLAEEKVVAPLELNQDKSRLISKEQGLEQIAVQLTNNSISEHGKRKEMLEVQKFITDQQQLFISSLLNLKSKIDEWMNIYIIIASEDGKVLFMSFFQVNELISNNQPLFYIEPPENKYYAEVMAGQSGLGKIKAQQRVVIKVESYPSEEFGFLTGRVSFISNIPNHRDSFLIKIDLPSGMNTSYNKSISFRNNLAARAEIVTDNRRLFHRLIGELSTITKAY